MPEGFAEGRRKKGENWGAPSVPTAQQKGSLSLRSLRGTIQVFFAHFFALSRPRISVYKRGRDATCCVRKREDEIAGKARKDTYNEGFADNIQIGAREVM